MCLIIRSDTQIKSQIKISILSIINRSLEEGIYPSAFKDAEVQPLLKKPNLDPSVFSIFRPISKLPFLSKIFIESGFLTTVNFYESK